MRTNDPEVLAVAERIRNERLMRLTATGTLFDPEPYETEDALMMSGALGVGSLHRFSMDPIQLAKEYLRRWL